MLFNAEAATVKSKPVNPSKSAKAAPGFATVGNEVISWQDYDIAYASEASNKFYHAKPTEEALAAFQREVADKLITNTLLVQEAKRRKMQPDGEEVNQELQKYEQRFANDPKWPSARIRVIPTITKKLQNTNLRNNLEKIVRDVAPPTTKQQHEYYEAHPEKFTSPLQPRISVILISVDPSSGEEEWDHAREEAEGLIKRMNAGEDFAALAREYSSDPTAEDGGDMGFMHAGMLPGLPEQVVSKLQPGENSAPVRLLEGMAIFRLTDRVQPEKSSFESSRDRVNELWLNEKSELAWNSLITKLKKQTPVHMDESRFLPLNAGAKNPTGKSDDKE